ncbi:hypothetical protein P153DRAFT_57349 [Dothidotthia symphoricarpi CBS 119687]|uniref:Uncharacterized protein n=1 Tax=Dothidotthia symphoricarpi CBS 119687 TaxID=1392245 RepID=A0A6A6A673_9PLEO|nr:uncharacterized protein P153DRAFT_57349 [Dothidotthia symphoricarpi CBS 119687]KAF2127056.1 hypothetical protein P153DRAFT_57349 [Dothidotthia symphoricarpi CBS 119687]
MEMKGDEGARSKRTNFLRCVVLVCLGPRHIYKPGSGICCNITLSTLFNLHFSFLFFAQMMGVGLCVCVFSLFAFHSIVLLRSLTIGGRGRRFICFVFANTRIYTTFFCCLRRERDWAARNLDTSYFVLSGLGVYGRTDDFVAWGVGCLYACIYAVLGCAGLG